MRQILRAGRVFDGMHWHEGASVLIEDGKVVALAGAAERMPEGIPHEDLGSSYWLVPGMIDLQVNGGDGVMLGAGCDRAMIARICAAHARLGATSILPTLITDTIDVTRQVIAAGIAAARARVPGFAGLHLEGPHLDPARKGAHDPALIRPMTAADLDLLASAAAALPALVVTLAPEAATPAQIRHLAAAGVVVSLGHSDCTAAAARAAQAAGARAVTHIFNTMSQLQSRAPGLVGAALCSELRAGIIADRVHVADEALTVALTMMAPDRLFLVSDAMAVAGTSRDSFDLGGRKVLRHDGRLTLEDGTLAGADISLPQAVANVIALGCDTGRALAMASRIPADLIGAAHLGRITPGAQADLLLVDSALRPKAVWQSGIRLADPFC